MRAAGYPLWLLAIPAHFASDIMAQYKYQRLQVQYTLYEYKVLAERCTVYRCRLEVWKTALILATVNK